MYDSEFFDVIRDGCRKSAEAVVPVILDAVGTVSTVVDVGCGEGLWAAEFQRHGCDVLGIDGEYVTDPLVPFEAHDISRPVRLDATFDLAVSLEVAEHLPRERATGFVADLCALADVVVFSAAIPGQGGTGHLNEQWPGYWADLFGEQGYAVSGALRWMIWEDDRVENWYRQNLLVAAKHPDVLPDVFDTPLSPVWPVVHPVLYDARR